MGYVILRMMQHLVPKSFSLGFLSIPLTLKGTSRGELESISRKGRCNERSTMIYYDYIVLLHPKILGPKTHNKERSSSQIIV